jgi:hypothetical protein
MEAVKVVPKPGQEPGPVEIIEQAIIDISAGMKALNNTRLKHETIVTLLHASSGVAKRDIRMVLAHMSALESTYLKPAGK